MNNNQEDLQTLIEKIKDIKVAMMTTMESDGSMRSRPMRHSEVKSDGYLWFFTGYNSGKSEEIKHDSHVNLSYSDIDDEVYVSISGKATLTRDQGKIEELWSPELMAWFPGGKDDPNIGLIRVSIDKAEYWDAPNSVMVHLYGMVKAAITGEAAHPGDNKKINL